MEENGLSEPENTATLPSEQANTTKEASDSLPSPKETIESDDKLKKSSYESPALVSSSAKVSPSLQNSADETGEHTPVTTVDDSAEEDENSAELKIPFVPGDHITRWEMLPIAWPIQVHGIVLEVHEDAVVLVDFGLAAVPEGKNHKKNKTKRIFGDVKQPQTVAENEPDVEESESSEQCDEAKDEPPQKEEKKDHVKNAIENFQKGFKKERNRLNVQTLTSQKEISKWSKVNYDGGMFGFGKKDGEGKERKIEDDEDERDSSDNKSSQKEKRESWWGNLMKAHGGKKKTELEQKKKEAMDAKTAGDSIHPSDNSIVTTSGGDSILRSESTDSSTPTNISSCGGMATCDTTPWWCRVSMQRGKRPNTSDKVAMAMMEASKNGELVQEFSRNEQKACDEDDFLMELEKRRMRRNLQQQHEDYIANVSENTVVQSISPTEADGTVDNIEMDDDRKGEHMSDENVAFDEEEEEKKDDHDYSYESVSKDKTLQLSVTTGDIDLSQTKATSLESPDASRSSRSSIGSPSSKSESESVASSTKSSSRKKRMQESKADPPAVVLARTRWLLKNGEGILPPYHAFSSNSECIAGKFSCLGLPFGQSRNSLTPWPFFQS